MSGGTFLERSLLTDIRFTRTLKKLESLLSESRTNSAVPDISRRRGTLEIVLLGSLSKLWLYADEHIREDNTLDLTTDEIDELVGIAGFTKILPADWLQVIEPDGVQLPDFIEHSIPQHSATDYERVRKRKWRAARKAQRQGSYSRPNVPDSTDCPGHMQSGPGHPREGNGKGREGKGQDLGGGVGEDDPVLEKALSGVLDAIQRDYPESIHGAHWMPTLKRIRQIIDAGEATADQLHGAVLRFCRQQQALGNLGTQFVMPPQTFFGVRPDDREARHWTQPWPVPLTTVKPKSETPHDRFKAVQAKWKTDEQHRTLDVEPESASALVAPHGLLRG